MPHHSTNIVLLRELKFQIETFRNSLQFLSFLEFLGTLEPHQSDAGVCFSIFYHIYIDLQYTLDKLFLRLHILHRAKPCQLTQIRSVVHHFSRAPVWRA